MSDPLMSTQAIKNLFELLTFIWNLLLSICSFVMDIVSFLSIPVKAMHISIADDTKKRFHAACAIRGLKMSQVISQLVEQWLKASDTSTLNVVSGEFVTRGKGTK